MVDPKKLLVISKPSSLKLFLIWDNSSVLKKSTLLEKNKSSKLLILILRSLFSRILSNFKMLISKLFKENSYS